MQFVPAYLKAHVIENITEYEVQNAPVGGWAITCKALTDEEITLSGLPKPTVAGKMYPAALANDVKDRHRERFTIPVLEKYALDFNRKQASLNFGHNPQNLIGSVVKGSAKVEGGVLKAVVFIDDLAIMPNQPEMTVNHAVKAGTVEDLSVEVSGSLRISEKDSEGWAKAWEYFIDPENPERTEAHGLALVMRGAQIDTALSVKALGAKPEPENKKSNPKNMKEFIFVDGKKHILTGKVEGAEIVVDATALKGLEDAISALETKATTATAEAEKYKALEPQVSQLRAPFEADVVNFQKALKLPESECLTADAVKALGPAELIAKANGLRARHDNGGGTEIVSVTTNEYTWTPKTPKA